MKTKPQESYEDRKAREAREEEAAQAKLGALGQVADYIEEHLGEVVRGDPDEQDDQPQLPL